MNVEKAMRTIAEKGCDRVITTHDGGSVPYENAISEFGIEVDFIFIDAKGYTIGCSRYMLTTAAHLRPWIAVLIRPLDKPMSFERFIKLAPSQLDAILPPPSGPPAIIPQPKTDKRYNRRR